jgi:hypothetical protein
VRVRYSGVRGSGLVVLTLGEFVDRVVVDAHAGNTARAAMGMLPIMSTSASSFCAEQPVGAQLVQGDRQVHGNAAQVAGRHRAEAQRGTGADQQVRVRAGRPAPAALVHPAVEGGAGRLVEAATNAADRDCAGACAAEQVDVVEAQAGDLGPRQRVHPGEQEHEPVVGADELVEQRASGGRVEPEQGTTGKPSGMDPPGGVGEDQPAGT